MVAEGVYIRYPTPRRRLRSHSLVRRFRRRNVSAPSRETLITSHFGTFRLTLQAVPAL